MRGLRIAGVCLLMVLSFVFVEAYVEPPELMGDFANEYQIELVKAYPKWPDSSVTEPEGSTCYIQNFTGFF